MVPYPLRSFTNTIPAMGSFLWLSQKALNSFWMSSIINVAVVCWLLTSMLLALRTSSRSQVESLQNGFQRWHTTPYTVTSSPVQRDECMRVVIHQLQIYSPHHLQYSRISNELKTFPPDFQRHLKEINRCSAKDRLIFIAKPETYGMDSLTRLASLRNLRKTA